MRHLRWIIPLVVIAAVIAAAAIDRFFAAPRGVDAIIHNTGTGTLRGVRVIVTGRAYAIGNLAPNQRQTVRVNPTGESDIVLTYTDANGAAQKLTAGCYFESGYSGTVKIEVADGKVVKIDDRIRI